ncbi:bromodomain-containing protein [Trifolium repens]|nr:bromodomain-containing protein [Trifolium repens]
MTMMLKIRQTTKHQSSMQMLPHMKGIYDSLCSTYEGNKHVQEAKATLLIQQYELFRMKDNENIESMNSRFKILVSGLQVLKRSYTTSNHARNILRSLRWRPKVTAIQEAKDLDTLGLEEMIGSLMSHEIELSSDEPQKKLKSVALPSISVSSKALKAKVVESEAEESFIDDQEDGSDDDVFALLSKKFQKLSTRRGKNFSSKGFGSRNNTSKEKKDDTKNCFNCHKPGHFMADCPELNSKGKGRKSTIKNKAKKSLMAIWEDINELSEDEDSEEANLALMAIGKSDNESDSESDTDDIDEVCTQRRKESSWYLDSGCSRHMIGDKLLFHTLNQQEGGTVGFGGNQKGKIIGIGTVGNSSLSISNVWLVDGLHHNLLSISQLSDQSIVFKSNRKGNVYKVNFSDLKEQQVLCLLTLSDEKWVWHKRLGHANWRLISKLSKDNLVRGLPKIKYHSDSLCGSCQKGKIVKSSFKNKNIVSSTRPLELLHIDLFGPVSTASINGKKYGLVIVDDYSRWTWVKILRTKADTYEVFSIFCTQIQNEKDSKNLKVRSDHGGEFENEPFEKICEEHGILHEFSSPRTPQQNGVVE